MSRRVRVSLVGAQGAGQSMLIDASDWAEVTRLFGNQWRGLKDSEGRLRVHTSRRRAIAAGAPYSNDQGLFLARWLVKPEAGQRVFHANGNTLDLTRANLSTNHPGFGPRSGGPVVVEEVEDEAA